jgi:methionyl-tRNA formyltransferase
MTLRTVFFGTPEFAVPSLAALHEVTRVVGVVCQPDRRSGRGMKLQASPVKVKATELGVPIYQPLRVKSGELESWLRQLQPDVAVVAAYGRILPAAVLAVPKHGCLNLHASLLPSYRGAAPIQWALMHGQTETGISLMHMDEGMDTGAVYAVRPLAIAPGTNAGQLTAALAAVAADVVKHELLGAVAGRLIAVPQDHASATLAPPISRQDLCIDWARPNVDILNQVRAFAPTPGAFTWAGERRLKILEAGLGSSGQQGTPGEILKTERVTSIEVACGKGTLELLRAGVEGRNVQAARDLINGRVIEVGQHLGLGGGAP